MHSSANVPMIKGLLLYKSDSGLYLHHKYNRKDINIFGHELAGMLHYFRNALEYGRRIRDFPVWQFEITVEQNRIKIRDLFNVHEKLNIHDKNGLSGVFSVRKDVPEYATQNVFEYVVDLISDDLSEKGRDLSDESKKKLDDFLEDYMIDE